MLVFTDGLGDLLREVTQKHETDTLGMVHVVKQIRKDILDMPGYTFDGSFAAEMPLPLYLDSHPDQK